MATSRRGEPRRPTFFLSYLLFKSSSSFRVLSRDSRLNFFPSKIKIQQSSLVTRQSLPHADGKRFLTTNFTTSTDKRRLEFLVSEDPHRHSAENWVRRAVTHYLPYLLLNFPSSFRVLSRDSQLKNLPHARGDKWARRAATPYQFQFLRLCVPQTPSCHERQEKIRKSASPASAT